MPKRCALSAVLPGQDDVRGRSDPDEGHDPITHDVDELVSRPERVEGEFVPEGAAARRELKRADIVEVQKALVQAARHRVVTCDWRSYTGPVDILLFADHAGGRYEVRVLRGNCPAIFDVSGVAETTPDLLRRIDVIAR